MRLEQELRQVKRIIFEHCKEHKEYAEYFFSVNFGSYSFVPIDNSTIYKGEHFQVLQGHTTSMYLCGVLTLEYINEIENDLRKKLRRYWAGGEAL